MFLLMRISGIVLVAATVMPYLFGCVASQRAALREVDIALTSASSAKNIERVASYLAEDARTLPPNGPAVAGKDATLKFWSESYSNPGFAVSCQFQKAEVSRAGDLGYTIGTYVLTLHDAEGKPATERGRYVTVWKKQRAGEPTCSRTRVRGHPLCG